jgi:hypothetical protein
VDTESEVLDLDLDLVVLGSSSGSGSTGSGAGKHGHASGSAGGQAQPMEGQHPPHGHETTERGIPDFNSIMFTAHQQGPIVDAHSREPYARNQAPPREGSATSKAAPPSSSSSSSSTTSDPHRHRQLPDPAVLTHGKAPKDHAPVPPLPPVHVRCDFFS